MDLCLHLLIPYCIMLDMKNYGLQMVFDKDDAVNNPTSHSNLIFQV